MSDADTDNRWTEADRQERIRRDLERNEFLGREYCRQHGHRPDPLGHCWTCRANVSPDGDLTHG